MCSWTNGGRDGVHGDGAGGVPRMKWSDEYRVQPSRHATAQHDGADAVFTDGHSPDNPDTMAMPTLLRRIVAAGFVAWCAVASLSAAFPAASGPVTDLAGVLSDAQEASLLSLLRDVEAQTTAEIAVVTVASLDGLTVEDYATGLFAAWGIGRATVDNGVLILVAPTEREMRVEVGYGLEGILPDGLAGSVIRTEFLPKFRDGDYAGGILAGTTRIADIVRRGQVLSSDERRVLDDAELPSGWIMVPFLGLFVTLGFLGIGAGLRSRAFGAVVFGVFFGGLPLALAAGILRRTDFRILVLIAVVTLVIGIYKGRQKAWREVVRGSGARGGGSGWVMGSFGERSSGSGSSSSDGFGGGSSGGGGASGRW